MKKQLISFCLLTAYSSLSYAGNMPPKHSTAKSHMHKKIMGKHSMVKGNHYTVAMSKAGKKYF